MIRRYTWLIASLMVVGLSCGGGDETNSTSTDSADAGSSGPQPVSVDFDMASGEDYRARMSGELDEELTGQGSAVNFRRNSDEIIVELAGKQFNLSVNYNIKEGQAGTFRSIKTPQLVRGSRRFVSKDEPIVITIDTFSNNQFEAAIAGEFGYTRSAGSDDKLDTPVRIEAKMNFEYQNRQK